jgi:hypothetical protein
MDWYNLNTLTNLTLKTIVVHTLYINIHVHRFNRKMLSLKILAWFYILNFPLWDFDTLNVKKKHLSLFSYLRFSWFEMGACLFSIRKIKRTILFFYYIALCSLRRGKILQINEYTQNTLVDKTIHLLSNKNGNARMI